MHLYRHGSIDCITPIQAMRWKRRLTTISTIKDRLYLLQRKDKANNSWYDYESVDFTITE